MALFVSVVHWSKSAWAGSQASDLTIGTWLSFFTLAEHNLVKVSVWMFWDSLSLPLSLSLFFREYQSGCGLLEECLASEVWLPCSDSGRAFLLNQASQAGYSGFTSYNQLLVLWRLQMVHNKICNPRIQCLDFVVCCHWPNRCSTAFFPSVWMKPSPDWTQAVLGMPPDPLRADVRGYHGLIPCPSSSELGHLQDSHLDPQEAALRELCWTFGISVLFSGSAVSSCVWFQVHISGPL